MSVYVTAEHAEPIWEPLERIAQLTRATPALPNVEPGEFMYMWRMVAKGRPDLHLYKHIFSRRYLNLDDAGHAYQFLGLARRTSKRDEGGRYRLWRDLRAAVEHLELDLFRPSEG